MENINHHQPTAWRLHFLSQRLHFQRFTKRISLPSKPSKNLNKILYLPSFPTTIQKPKQNHNDPSNPRRNGQSLVYLRASNPLRQVLLLASRRHGGRAQPTGGAAKRAKPNRCRRGMGESGGRVQVFLFVELIGLVVFIGLVGGVFLFV